ncbi:glutamate--cysteine ligase [Aquisalimonas lutea]|uniref:glutamate--cysteine ligase n=1 Tax=Aquisalimonas lutea TaxID=1327750 RepID=UPI0025B40826|nr:glutamate--cysteine ligase [Aquisalimonas lutea]MDN3518948.1 glutamate--cysteine ligase [Aquisalimonas lutea]
MVRNAEKRLASLLNTQQRGLLRGSLKGLEKESLRVDRDGHIAQTPHPRALGSSLTHPWITTDYSEALLEFITPPESETGNTLGFLEDVHTFAYHNIGDELLWATSMPCIVGGDASIPIAWYGESNVGWMKHIYRRGLDWRYGRAMQAISGIHFNYSFSDAFWEVLREHEGDARDLQTFVSDAYFRLIRNFQRFGWLVPFLFGASPAVCKSFTGGQNIDFHDFDEHTFYEPFGTSLRMSDIGYKNNAQAALNISYNDLDSYVRTLERAIATPDPEWQRIGTRVNGEWRQLSTNTLQIENEYYSFVRPKAVARSGERPSRALHRAGVEYIEIRALDLNPFEPLGVNAGQLHFLEALLVYCLLEDSPEISAREQCSINHNQGQVARYGRDPELVLDDGGTPVRLRDWAERICGDLETIAELLDQTRPDTPYGDAVRYYRDSVRDADRTPSAQVLASMRGHGENFIEFAMRQSRQHEHAFKEHVLDPETRRRLEEASRTSLEEQAAIERRDTLSFEEYLARYFDQTETA